MYSRDDLVSLLSWEQGPCVSIYLETARSGPDVRRNSIELKNALDDADERLKAAGIADSRTHEAILSPLKKWRDDTDLHQHLDRGMAIFLAPGFARYLLSPEAFAFQVDVGDAFRIRPLLPLLQRERDFRLLTLDRDDVRLFEGNSDGLRERKSELPESWDKLRSMTEYQKQTGFHPSGPTPTTDGTPTPKYHAYGESPEDLRKTQTDAFVQAVAKAVTDVHAAGPDIPLVLCAGSELAGMFRQHYRGRGLIDSFIEANPVGLDEAELHERACALVSPAMDVARDAAAARLAALDSDDADRASTDVSDVVAAAMQGRVETLFVPRDTTLPGQFNEAAQKTVVHQEAGQGDVDLCDLAARETLLHGGAVFTPLQQNMPVNASIAAILRY